MTTASMEYPLENGYINNWLVAGPQFVNIADTFGTIPAHSESDLRKRISNQRVKKEIDFTDMPVYGSKIKTGLGNLKWDYLRCYVDHFVDVSATYQGLVYVRTWAYSQIKSPLKQQVNMVLTTFGPVDVWVNNKHSYHGRSFGLLDPLCVNIVVQLFQGVNEILIRFDQACLGQCPNVMALRLMGFVDNETEKKMVVVIPSREKDPTHHQLLEKVLDTAYLEEVVNTRGVHFNLGWANDLDVTSRYTYYIMDEQERIYVQGTRETDKTQKADVGHTYKLNERPYYVTLGSPGGEFSEIGLRYKRKLPLHVLDTQYTSQPSGTLEGRTRAALEDATKHTGNLYSEIAKMELGHWDEVNTQVILNLTSDPVNRQDNGVKIDNGLNPIVCGHPVSTDILGLIGIVVRYMTSEQSSSLPQKIKQLQQPVLESIRKYLDLEAPTKFIEKIGNDESNQSDPHAEVEQIIILTCKILAGQIFAETYFSDAKLPGKQISEKYGKLALVWMRQKGTTGFNCWNSSLDYESIIAALAHLASLAEDDQVSEMATVLLDKSFFIIATHSFKGTSGSARRMITSITSKSGQLDPISGISRMLWGTGVFNHYIVGTVSLACSHYEFPTLIGDIANDRREEMWSQEQSGNVVNITDNGNNPGVNIVTYRTPDTMLSSAQDYRPGEKGDHEHIWQATLGHDAIVFVNHPGAVSENDAHRAGYWHGNAVLPRVAQWKDTLIALYQLPDNDWMRFSHAYFPISAFDEYEIKNSRVFGKKGNGYIALTAIKGFELVKRAPDGYRELRSYGLRTGWICQTGRSEIDGDFSKFIKIIDDANVQSQGVDSDAPSSGTMEIQFKTHRNDEISFGWQKPLIINGKERPLKGYKQFENPYCTADLLASTLEISFNDYMMRLNFE
jgi:hypothetical protein